MINEDTQKNVYKRMQITGKADLRIVDGLTLAFNYSYMADQNTLLASITPPSRR